MLHSFNALSPLSLIQQAAPQAGKVWLVIRCTDVLTGPVLSASAATVDVDAGMSARGVQALASGP
jgi:hypothetical protein